MKTYRVYEAKIFSDKLNTMPKDFKEWVEKIKDQLVSNPYVGKPLGVDWLREKKDQQKVINTIKLFLEMYKEELMELTRK